MFWKKSSDAKKEAELPKPVELGRNDPCHCGSGKKYKKCCIDKDAVAQRKAMEEHFAKSASNAVEQAEKKDKDAPATPGKSHAASKSTKAQHPTFVANQVSMPRKSGGG